MPKTQNSAPFTLKSSNELFLQRQKSVFDQLNNLQCNLQNNNVENMETDEVVPTIRTNRLMMKQFRGKESIFKRPQDPIHKNYMKSIPDFKKNPHKWKKYSLADVEDMSDTCNTKAALSFLNELKSRNSARDEDDITEAPKKIVFKKITGIEKVAEDGEKIKSSFKSSKVVMPEYVVGQKVVREKKNKDLKNSGSCQLKLDHLYDEDE